MNIHVILIVCLFIVLPGTEGSFSVFSPNIIATPIAALFFLSRINQRSYFITFFFILTVSFFFVFSNIYTNGIFRYVYVFIWSGYLYCFNQTLNPTSKKSLIGFIIFLGFIDCIYRFSDVNLSSYPEILGSLLGSGEGTFYSFKVGLFFADSNFLGTIFSLCAILAYRTNRKKEFILFLLLNFLSFSRTSYITTFGGLLPYSLPYVISCIIFLFNISYFFYDYSDLSSSDGSLNTKFGILIATTNIIINQPSVLIYGMSEVSLREEAELYNSAHIGHTFIGMLGQVGLLYMISYFVVCNYIFEGKKKHIFIPFLISSGFSGLLPLSILPNLIAVYFLMISE